MITGRWGKPSEVLLDIVVAEDGTVRGTANPGRQNARIREGRYDAATGTVTLGGEFAPPGAPAVPFRIAGRLDGRTLRLAYAFGDLTGNIDLVRVEEYRPGPITLRERLVAGLAPIRRWLAARTRPSPRANARRLQQRGETMDSIHARDAVATDIPALAELHVTTWNATYNTTRGPTVATRTWQWEEVFAKGDPREFVLVLEDRSGRLIGFTRGRAEPGATSGELSKIYLRWEYHGLGLGRRMMRETAQRFRARGIDSFVLFADLGNPTLGFYERMGGRRMVDDRGYFSGGYRWDELDSLLG